MSAQAMTEEISVVVKHTFIDVSLPSMATDDSATSRRSSVPACMWLCPSGVEEPEVCATSDVSTNLATGYVSGSQRDESEEEDEEEIQHLSLLGHGRFSTWDPEDASFEFDSTCVETNVETNDETIHCSTPEKRTALRSTAKAWQPMQAEAWQSQRFDKQVADIKAKVEVAMLCSGYDADITIAKESNGYTVSMTMRAEDVEQFGDAILADAQQTLLTASEQSTCVCILGYGHQPFQPLKLGFIATLAEMSDEASACWDMYAWGACRYGCSCVRQHPRSVAYIVVQLVA